MHKQDFPKEFNEAVSKVTGLQRKTFISFLGKSCQGGRGKKRRKIKIESNNLHPFAIFCQRLLARRDATGG